MKTYITIATLFLISCAKQSKLPTPVGVENYGLSTTHGTRAGDLNGIKDFVVERKAEMVSGTMTGPKSNAAPLYQADSCIFSYEKGSGRMSETSPDFKYESLILTLTGKNELDETTFERVSYSNVDFINLYNDWDFQKSFGPVELDNSAKYGTNTKEATMEFIKKREGASIIFENTFLFEGGESSFFTNGEIRKYTTTLNFAVFNTQKVILNNANVKVRRVNEEDNQLLVNVDCLNFK